MPEFLLAALLSLLHGCAAIESARWHPPAERPPVPFAAESAWQPAPALQKLIDPVPEVLRPSWLGGDVATSVRLTDDHYLWLFGDTLLGSVATECPMSLRYCDRRVDEDGFIANSVGVMTRDLDGSFFPIFKYWRTEDGKPAPIFAAEDPTEFLWPLAGLVVEGRLLVTATRQTREEGLASHGNVLVIVDNPEDPPDQWSYTRHEIPHVLPSAGPDASDRPLSWATALVREGDFLYLFGSRGEAATATTVVARFPVADLVRSEPVLRPSYLLRGKATPVWSRRFDAERLYEIEGLPGTSEATIDRVPGAERWSMPQIPPLEFGIREYQAEHLLGPWRDQGVVYWIPAPWSAPRPQSKTAFAAYAAKAHPELGPPGRAALSYNVNVAFGTLEEAIEAVETVHGFYVPQMLERVP